jgi:phage shock protein PspC (stress-responsive transcriptional regulator)
MTEKPKNPRKTKETQAPKGRPLLRSSSDRMISGVAGGLAPHIGVDPGWVRAGFVVSILFGGIGILAYIVMAVVLPVDDGSGKAAVGDTAGSRALRAAVVLVLASLALSAAAAVAVGAAWLTAIGHGTIVAGIVIAVGIAIVAAAFLAGTRPIAAGLLGLALVIGLPAGAVAAADVHFDSSIGERTYTPAAIADIPDDGYRLGVGQLVVDLRKLPWQKGQKVAVSSRLGVGQLIVSVPTDVCVKAHATGKAGELLVRGEQSDGVDPEVTTGTPRGDAPQLDLDAEIDAGQMIVTDQAPSEIDTHGADYDHNRLSKESQQKACGL